MSGWTEARVATLKKLQLDGLSASQIAAQLGGVTRNAVISKLIRLGLPGGGKRRTVAKAALVPAIKRKRGERGPDRQPRKVSPDKRGGRSWSAASASVVVRTPSPSYIDRFSHPEDLERMTPAALPMLAPVPFAALEAGQCRWCVDAALDPAGPEMACCGAEVIDRFAPEGRREATHCRAHFALSTGNAWQGGSL